MISRHSDREAVTKTPPGHRNSPSRWPGPSGRGCSPRPATPRLSDSSHPSVKHLLKIGGYNLYRRLLDAGLRSLRWLDLAELGRLLQAPDQRLILTRYLEGARIGAHLEKQ